MNFSSLKVGDYFYFVASLEGVFAPVFKKSGDLTYTSFFGHKEMTVEDDAEVERSEIRTLASTARERSERAAERRKRGA